MDRYVDWLPKIEASRILQCSIRSIERMVEAGKVQQAQRRVPGRKPLTVVNPADVERIREETMQPAPFVLPAEVQVAPPATVARNGVVPLPELMRQVIDGRHVPRFLTLPEAAKYVGLPEAYLRARVKDGTLRGVKAAGWRVRTCDLDYL